MRDKDSPRDMHIVKDPLIAYFACLKPAVDEDIHC